MGRLKLALSVAVGIILSTLVVAKDVPPCSAALSELILQLGSPIDPSAEVCLKNVPHNYLSHPHFFEWARDPDQSNAGDLGRISKQSIREAMAAIELERSGQVVGPISRGERAKHADFVDGRGDGFDIKAFSSRRELQGKDFDPDKAVKEIVKKLNRSFLNTKTNRPSSIRIYMDLTWLNSADRQRVKDALDSTLSAELVHRICFFELPEPQVQFQARAF